MKRIMTAILLCICIFLTQFMIVPTRVFAADKTISLIQVQQLAAANSSKYRNILNKIEMQQVKYEAAVKSIQMKKKNMRTFRWTPLLSFKFPEQPTLADEYDWQYKPLQITCQIDELRHQLNAELIKVRETVSLLYVDAYIAQQKISFDENRLETAQNSLKRNRARLATGEASQNDISKIEQSIKNLETDLSLQMRTLEAKKSKIAALINLDISTGYRFENPCIEAEIPRSALSGLINYTLDNDQSYYETKMDTQLALTSMNMTESLMNNQYGSKMNAVKSFVTQARNGQTIDGTAFKAVYNQMLLDIDAKWNGTKKILFFRIKREWFKGAVDGSRYVEDDPYALYTAALEYADAKKEQEAAKKELTASVKDGFENLVTARNAYYNMIETSQEYENDLEKAKQQNQLGTLSYEDYTAAADDYEQAELDTLSLLSEYSKLLFSYDCLTCGAVTSYLKDAEAGLSGAAGGISNLVQEQAEGAYYYIKSRIEDNLFVFGVWIPDDFSLTITHFELYVDGTRIGDKTETDQVIEHLTLDFDSVEHVKIYLYNEDELLDICEIDSTVNQAELAITEGYRLDETQTDRTVAASSYTVNQQTNTVAFNLVPEDTENIAYFQLVNREGTAVGEGTLVSVDESFIYLGILTDSLSELKINLYDSNQKLLYTGQFDEQNASVVLAGE